MILLPRRCLLAIVAVVDVAVYARISPVTAKAISLRNNLHPRHLEALLQSLVRGDVLRGVRGPRGGYELARERRRVTVADIVRASFVDDQVDEEESEAEASEASILNELVVSVMEELSQEMLTTLEALTIDALCQRLDIYPPPSDETPESDFII